MALLTQTNNNVVYENLLFVLNNARTAGFKHIALVTHEDNKQIIANATDVWRIIGISIKKKKYGPLLSSNVVLVKHEDYQAILSLHDERKFLLLSKTREGLKEFVKNNVVN